MFLRFDELANSRTTEQVDRLIRVSTHEDTAAIVRLPCLHKAKQKFVLAGGGILGLVYEKMAHAVFVQQRIADFYTCAKGQDRSLSYFGEVHRSATVKGQHQVGHQVTHDQG